MIKLEYYRYKDRFYCLLYIKEVFEKGYKEANDREKLIGQNEYDLIDSYCNDSKIDWFASAWDIKSQIFLRQFNCKFNKVASAMIVDKELLETIASENKHTFISTGMSKMEYIEDAVKIFKC